MLSKSIEYEIAPEAKVRLLLHREIFNQIDSIITRSAIVTSQYGNRRFHNWIFDVHDGVIRRATNLADTTKRPNQFIVYEICENCPGQECPSCGGKGEIRIVRHLR